MVRRVANVSEPTGHVANSNAVGELVDVQSPPSAFARIRAAASLSACAPPNFTSPIALPSAMLESFLYSRKSAVASVGPILR